MSSTIVMVDTTNNFWPEMVGDWGIDICGFPPSFWKQVTIPDCLQIAICWGERCTEDLVLKHPKGRFFDLLLATEYWLSFYRTSVRDDFRLVSSEDIDCQTIRNSSELVIKGSCVFAGYCTDDEAVKQCWTTPNKY